MRIASTLVLCLWLSSSKCANDENAPRNNIIVILVDDLDDVLGGLEPMSISRRFAGLHGATFTNAFVSTPVCCPSRSSILTGKYVHNHGVINNTASGNCSSRHWQDGDERRTMATYLKSQGYTTFYGGKYLNQYGKEETGGVQHIPPGYDRWVGLVGNSRYYNYTLSVDGRRREHGDNYHHDYLTDVLASEALDFIKKSVSPYPARKSNKDKWTTGHRHKKSNKRPFFAMIAPPACHSPFTPAEPFANAFADRRAPRWPSFNRHPAADKHWLVRQSPAGPLPAEIVDRIDHVYRQRWRTLLSVDQMVGRVARLLKRAGQLERTWMILTSDHGYHMGQFAMPIDKRLPYETDIRVPLLILNRPGGHTPLTIDSLAVVSIDLAPTVLDMAGISIPPDMDGLSLLPLITGDNEEASPRVDRWRSSYLIEYHGEADLEDVDPQCQQDANTTLCLSDYDCKCQDAANNTYVCVRTLSATGNSLYCQFDDAEQFVEYYNLVDDPYQLRNIADELTTSQQQQHQRLLSDYTTCTGHRACSPTTD